MLRNFRRIFVAASCCCITCALSFIFCYHLLIGRDLIKQGVVPTVPWLWIGIVSFVGAITGAWLGLVSNDRPVGRWAIGLVVGALAILVPVVVTVSGFSLSVTKKEAAPMQEQFLVPMASGFFVLSTLLVAGWLLSRIQISRKKKIP